MTVQCIQYRIHYTVFTVMYIQFLLFSAIDILLLLLPTEHPLPAPLLLLGPPGLGLLLPLLPLLLSQRLLVLALVLPLSL